MASLDLDLFYEAVDDELCTHELAACLIATAERLAPSIDLNIHVMKASQVERWPVVVSTGEFQAVRHAPSVPGHQSLLLTRVPLVHYGYGQAGIGVVSMLAAEDKKARGGDPVDIVIHEWIHTLQGIVLNGRPVPFVDDAENFGYHGVPGPDGEPRWEDWNRHCLGGDEL